MPKNVELAFLEGAKCNAIGCWNASGAMFRAAIDLASQEVLERVSSVAEDSNAQVSRNVRNKLFFRLEWLIENNHLADDLAELADCIREDGNDSVHDCNLGENDAADLRDFAYELLNRTYSIPRRTEIAKQRRVDRRAAQE